MYGRRARFYDAIYSHLDYGRQAEAVHELAQAKKQSEGKQLLDVACGTGLHLEHLRRDYGYEVEGLDISEEMIAVARGRLPDVPLHVADMTDFDLGRRFDVVTCLFSSIGHMLTEDLLKRTIVAMADHLEPGGVMIVEGWLTPDVWIDGHLHLDHVDRPDLKIARLSVSRSDGDISVIDMYHLIGTSEEVQSFSESMRLRMFTVQQCLDAFRAADLNVEHDPQGLRGRDLYVAATPLA